MARSKNNVIGVNNKLAWNIPEDLKFFKEKTTNNVVIMGSQTFLSLSKPLKNRINIVVTKQKKYLNGKNLIFVDSVEKALNIAKIFKKKIFLIGGEKIAEYAFKQNMINEIFLTEVLKEIEIKKENKYSFFPKFNNNLFSKKLLISNNLIEIFEYKKINE